MAKPKFKISDEIQSQIENTKQDNSIIDYSIVSDEIDAIIESNKYTRGMNPISQSNLRPRKKAEPKKKSYMQIDVAQYEDYLYRLSKFRNIPITKYVVQLIEADYNMNKDLYEHRLLLDNAYDKPERISPNAKNK